MHDRVIEIHDSFSIPLFVVKLEGLTEELKLKDKIEKEFIENIYDHSECCPSRDYEHEPWLIAQTNPNLHEKIEFAAFKMEMIKAVSCISRDLMKYDKNYLVDVTGMWGCKQRPKASLHLHSHHNNIFSGVFYPEEDNDFPHIRFKKPFNSEFLPTVSEANIYNSGFYFGAKPSKDNLIIFPSWLEHEVPANFSNKDRLSISFNAMLRGKFQDEISYQSAHF